MASERACRAVLARMEAESEKDAEVRGPRDWWKWILEEVSVELLCLEAVEMKFILKTNAERTRIADLYGGASKSDGFSSSAGISEKV